MTRHVFFLALAIGGLSAAAQTTYDAKILEYTGLRYACDGDATPVLKIQNVGSSSMSGCVVETWKNGIQQNSFDWQLAIPAPQGEVRQPSFPPVNVEPGDELEFRIISVNTIPDEDPVGNILAIEMDQAPAQANGGDMEVEIDLGDDPGSVVWSVSNALNQVVAQGGPYEDANITVTEELALAEDACFTFRTEDLSRSAAANSVKVKRAGNTLISANPQSPYSKGLTTLTDGPCTNNLEVVITTDDLGSENRWEIVEQGSGEVRCTGGPYADAADTYTETCCLPDGCYLLRVHDDGGDGIAGGGYLLRDESHKRIIDNTGNFGSSSFSGMSDADAFCVPLGTDRLISTSCDKLDWRTSPCTPEYVVANANQDVSDEYSVSNATSGYQMWWFDPNGTYSFRRFQSHNTPNGLSAGPTRACHFKLNAWNGNQLQQGVLYNVKVRGRVNGDYNEWGPACRLMIDNAAAQCPRAKLNDIAGNAYFSCGATRPIASNAFVHARPVRRMLPSCTWLNAKRYQFRFRSDGNNPLYTVVKTANTYFVNTTGLVCGRSYDVDVRASFETSGTNWCAPNGVAPWGDVCLLTISCPPEIGGNQNMVEVASTGSAQLRMYPNPNRGDQLMLSLEWVEEGVHRVSVDILDAFGKRVSLPTGQAGTRAIATQGGFFNTVITLKGELAAGLYLVNIIAGDKVYTERLVIQP
ncbi:MAG: T9SS type A sorting domain-containing protein [Flavobacteriales bacterium]|nr:T9SS type A sorting domain-containing protein [Flavobacteriales bacterium]